MLVKTARYLWCVLILMVLLSLTAAAEDCLTLTTTGDPENAVHFAISGDTVTVSGKLDCARLTHVWVHVGEQNMVLETESGQTFSAEFPLSHTEGTVPVAVYTKKSSETVYWSYVWQTVLVEKTAAGYRFVTTSVYDHNTAMMESWLNPADWLGGEVDPAVKSRSDAIVGTETDSYQKLKAIHKWVAENIYYDNDYAAGRAQSVPETAAQVLAERRGVCGGYAALVQALVQAQGIPCMVVSSYGAGTGTDGFISEDDNLGLNQIQHAHAVAWLNGRWIHMDTTWDSANRYEYGRKNTNPTSGILYFDPTMEMLSLNHKILSVPTPAEENTPSDWAVPEIRTALQKQILPYSLQGKYRSAISRARFCEILMTMLTRRMGYASAESWIEERGLAVNAAVFSDIGTQDCGREILIANALGIVNGRGNGVFDPDSGITRQEAAAMLMRAAQVLDIDMGVSPMSFTDITQADDWAVIGILYASSLADKNGQIVMGGMGDGSFSPKTTYTVEQSVLTMVRMLTVAQP